MRLIIAECSVDYAGRLSAHLPKAKRLLVMKADGSVLVHSDSGSYKPLNWMNPPCTVSVLEPSADQLEVGVQQVWQVQQAKTEDVLLISIFEVLSEVEHELGEDPGLIKDGVEKHLQELLADQLHLVADGATLVRREYFTAIGPVDILMRDASGATVAIELKRRGDIDGVEQLTRYLELLNRDPLLAPVRGVFAAQEIKPQARKLAEDLGIECLVLDYDSMRGIDDGKPRLFKRLGPGLVTGAADDDPSGIGTYTSVGAAAGYGFLWSALWLLPLAFAVQEACARLALVTGKGLAAIIKARMPRWVLVLAVALVAVANTVNIAADLAIMSSALGLIVPVQQWIGVVLFAVLLAVSEIAIPYHRYSRVLRWLCLSLLAYVAVLFVAKVDWERVATSTLLPHFDFSRVSFELLLALAGTTISPYLFFWQAAEEIEERKNLRTRRVRLGNIEAMRGDVFAGMFTGVFIMFAIMATSAATLNAQGITDIATASDAALALKPIAGEFAGLLFLLGILGVGLLSIPVLAGSTAYAVAETFGWRESLELKPRQAKAFYGVIVVSMLVALGLNLVGIAPVHFLFLAAVLNGLTAPVLMIIVWLLARDKNLLGKWASPRWSQVLLGVATVAMGSLPVFWLLAS